MNKTILKVSFMLTLLVLLPSCETIGYYKQAVGGQLEILQKSKPISQVVAQESTSATLKKKLNLVREVCRFAENELGYNVGNAYTQYADLGREHVVWNISAAPELSLEEKEWSYPFVGSLSYRGYFAEKDAEEYAKQLRGEGYDVFVGKVDAYSTLGWFNDPVLNTFVYDSDVDLAELIFHELTHRHYFVKGDTDFNEALASAVSYYAVQRWLESKKDYKSLKRYNLRLKRRHQMDETIEQTRNKLKELYASKLSRDQKLQEKKEIIQKLQNQLRHLYKGWGGKAPESWLNELPNNARLNAVSTYYRQVPKFTKMLKEEESWSAFFVQVKRLTKTTKALLPR